MRRLLLAAAWLVLSAFCPTPNPNLLGPPNFVDDCPVPAAGLNLAAPLSSIPVAVEINPTVSPYNCVGNGTADDTACMQAALNAAANGVLVLGPNKYLISAGLSLSSTVSIVGTNGNVGVYSTSCPTGFITNSDITLLTLTGPTAKVSGVCFQMATGAGQRASGAAIAIGATATTGQGHALVENNTIIYPFDGIVNGGATTGTTQTNTNILSHNVIVSPSNRGIANGPLSTGTSTNGTELYGNQIACFASNTGAIGVALYDGSVDYDGTEAGPYNCNIGLAIIPGASQHVDGDFTGVLGDTSRTESLLVDATATTGSVGFLRFGKWWAATNTNTIAGGHAVLLRNTGGGVGRVHGITFSGGQAHGCNAGTGLNLIALENDVYDVTLVGNRIAAECSQTNDIGILNSSTGAGGRVDLTVSGNSFVASSGTLVAGFKNTAAADYINVSNNMFSDGVTTGIVWTVGPPAHYVTSGNLP